MVNTAGSVRPGFRRWGFLEITCGSPDRKSTAAIRRDMPAHVTETDPDCPTLSPGVEQVLNDLLRGAVERGDLSQAAAHAVSVAAWHMAAMADDHADEIGVGRIWPSALRHAHR